MEALPLELREHISSFVFPRISQTGAVADVPVSYQASKIDVYNLRLTCHRMNEGAQKAFVRIIEDVPTQCTEQSLLKLGRAIALVGGHNITHLTFNMCKLYAEETSTPRLNMQRIFEEAQEHKAWIRGALQGAIAHIFREASRLKHLTLVSEMVHWTLPANGQVYRAGPGVFSMGREIPAEEEAARMPDPLKYIQQALVTTNKSATLETLNILCREFTDNGTSPQGSTEPLLLPALKHLTFAPRIQAVSDFRVLSPGLESLHIILENQGHRPDFGSSENPFILDPRRGTLRELVLNANGDTFMATGIMDCILPVMQKLGREDVNLETLTIRDVIAVADISDDVPHLPQSLRIKNLVFQDAMVSFTDEITLSGPSDPKEMHAGWKGFTRLCERADVVMMRTGGGERERVLEREEWLRPHKTTLM